MRCPHCKKKVSRLKRAINSLPKASRICPHCDLPVRVVVRNKGKILVALLFSAGLMLSALVSSSTINAHIILIVGNILVVVIGAVALRMIELRPFP